MNRKRRLYSLLFLSLFLITDGVAEELGAVEKRKSIVKIYDVTSRDNLTVENQFGDVKVALWERDEIRVDIVITANAASEDKAQEFLNAVSIAERRSGDQIILKTVIEKGTSFGNKWDNVKKMAYNNNGEKSGIKINYQVSMPKQNALTVRNQFGNTTIPTFRAPLNIVNKFGSFYATDLQGGKYDIDVQFGKADIREMDHGKLNVQYSKLALDKAQILTLVNQFGSMQIGEVGKLNADIGYSGAKIGTVKESCKVNLSFSGGFQIEQLPRTADNVDINASYSSVRLPALQDGDCQFDVTVSYGGFRYPTENSRIMLTTQPGENDRSSSRMTKKYSGKVGNGSGPRVRVVSTFGDVSFR